MLPPFFTNICRGVVEWYFQPPRWVCGSRAGRRGRDRTPRDARARGETRGPPKTLTRPVHGTAGSRPARPGAGSLLSTTPYFLRFKGGAGGAAGRPQTEKTAGSPSARARAFLESTRPVPTTALPSNAALHPRFKRFSWPRFGRCCWRLEPPACDHRRGRGLPRGLVRVRAG